MNHTNCDVSYLTDEACRDELSIAMMHTSLWSSSVFSSILKFLLVQGSKMLFLLDLENVKSYMCIIICKKFRLMIIFMQHSNQLFGYHSTHIAELSSQFPVMLVFPPSPASLSCLSRHLCEAYYIFFQGLICNKIKRLLSFILRGKIE